MGGEPSFGSVRTELLRKVASLCRERSALNQRLTNIAGAHDGFGLIKWIAQEALGLVADGDALIFAAGPLAGQRVHLSWTFGDGAPAHPRGSSPHLAFVEHREITVAPGRVPDFIDQIWLIDSAGVRSVFPTSESQALQLDDEQRAVIARFSSTALPALTRYH